jgi:hypothetical protein
VCGGEREQKNGKIQLNENREIFLEYKRMFFIKIKFNKNLKIIFCKKYLENDFKKKIFLIF